MSLVPQYQGWDVIDQDKFLGITTLHRYDESEDRTIIRSIHHTTEAAIEGNRKAANDFDHYSTRNSEMVLVASIPTLVQYEWLTRYGVDIFNKDHQSKVKKLLNDPEWAYLKRAPLVI